MLTELLQFLTEQGEISPDGLVGWGLLIIILFITASITIYHILDSFFSFLGNIKFRKTKEVIVKEYLTPPVNKEVDIYLKKMKDSMDKFEKIMEKNKGGIIID